MKVFKKQRKRSSNINKHYTRKTVTDAKINGLEVACINVPFFGMQISLP